MTSLYVSQVVRQSLLDPNPALRVSQVARQTVVFPNGQLRVSQVVRMTVIQAPEPETFYCWARITTDPGIYATTPVYISPAS